MCFVNLPSKSEQLDFNAPIPATKLLVAAMLVAHVAAAVMEWWGGFEGLAEGLLYARDVRFRVSVGGQHSDMIWSGEAWRLWTSIFVHVDLLHLLLNVTALYALGRLVEPWIGGIRLWSWFTFGGALGGTLSWLAAVPMSDGASGGAFTLLAVALVIGSELRPQLIEEDARLLGPVLLGFTLLNLVLGFALPFVDGIAHLAGLFAGLLLGSIFGRNHHPMVTMAEVSWLVAVAGMFVWAVIDQS